MMSCAKELTDIEWKYKTYADLYKEFMSIKSYEDLEDLDSFFVKKYTIN